MINCSNVTKSIGGSSILRGVSLDVRAGSIAALIGRSGAGKTTLLRILGLVDNFSAGSVIVDNISVGASNDTEMRNPSVWPNVTLVFQDLFLWPHMTNRENIMLPATKRHGGLAHEILADLLRRLDLFDFIDRFPNEVSRGQRQVIAIARAMALKPRVLLLDEATASIDMPRSLALSQLFKEYAHDGTTVLFITHSLGFARNTAEQIIFMENGIVEEAGSVEVLDRPRTDALRSFVRLVEQTM